MSLTIDLPSDARIPTSIWDHDGIPAPKVLDVLTQIAHFFDRLGYTKSLSALLKEAGKSGFEIDIAEWDRSLADGHVTPFLDLFAAYHGVNGSYPTLSAEGSNLVKDEISDDSESESESDSDSETTDDDDDAAKATDIVDVVAEETSDDSSDEDSDDESGKSSLEEPKIGTKRKRVLTPPSSDTSSSLDSDSDSDSSSDSSSEESDARPVKKAKIEVAGSANDSDIDSDSDSDASDSSASSLATSTDSSDDDSSSSEDSSSSDSDGADATAPAKKSSSITAAKLQKASSLSQKLGSKTAATPKAGTKGKAVAKASSNKGGNEAVKEESVSSATLDGDSDTHMHPDRLKRMPPTESKGKKAGVMKKEAVIPFSRIPANQVVDPRFASNDYVPYDYANRAYQDLVVTKGKGFTKEKNKKKRGSYRGGMIDLAPKGIKFDD